MGAVYVAEEASTGRSCALKLMHERLINDPKNRARFAQEAAVSEHIGTDHVVDVYGRGIDEPTGMLYIAMELLEGETLQARIWRGGRPNVLPLVETLAVLDQLSAVLEAAHARALVHRDLKPENIFLTPRPRSDAPFTLKLLDFGVARFVDPHRPVFNATAAIGTPLWMAPEQHSGGEISPAADVWAVGLIAFQLLTGRFYWLAANQKELNIPMLLQELMFDPLPVASQRALALGCVDRIPSTFDAWFSRCVSREAQARFSTATPMRGELRAALSGPMLSAPPSTPPTSGALGTALAETLAFAESSPALPPEAPTSVHAPVPFDQATSLFVPSVPAARGSKAQTMWQVPVAIVLTTGVLLGALAMVYRQGIDPRGWLRGPRVAEGRGGEIAAPEISATPSLTPMPRSPVAPSIFLDGERRSWHGSLASRWSGDAGFDLELSRVGATVSGFIVWIFSDGGTRSDAASGLIDDTKGELTLLVQGDNQRQLRASLLASGGLSGEFLPGGGQRPIRFSAALKTPLVAAPPP